MGLLRTRHVAISVAPIGMLYSSPCPLLLTFLMASALCFNCFPDVNISRKLLPVVSHCPLIGKLSYPAMNSPTSPSNPLLCLWCTLNLNMGRVWLSKWVWGLPALLSVGNSVSESMCSSFTCSLSTMVCPSNGFITPLLQMWNRWLKKPCASITFCRGSVSAFTAILMLCSSGISTEKEPGGDLW